MEPEAGINVKSQPPPSGSTPGYPSTQGGCKGAASLQAPSAIALLGNWPERRPSLINCWFEVLTKINIE